MPITPATTNQPLSRNDIKKLVQQLQHELTTIGNHDISLEDPLQALYLTDAHTLIALTHAGTLQINDPNNTYQGLLKPTLQRLRNLKEEDLPAARTRTLQQLKNQFHAYEKALDTGGLDTLPTLTDHPDHQNQKDDEPAQTIPAWPTTPEGKTAELWNCLVLGTWWINRQLGIHPASLNQDGTPPTPAPHNHTNLDAPPPPGTTHYKLYTYNPNTQGLDCKPYPIEQHPNLPDQLRAHGKERLEDQGLEWALAAAHGENHTIILASPTWFENPTNKTLQPPPPAKRRARQ
jgi:hypothetical protein